MNPFMSSGVFYSNSLHWYFSSRRDVCFFVFVVVFFCVCVCVRVFS